MTTVASMFLPFLFLILGIILIFVSLSLIREKMDYIKDKIFPSLSLYENYTVPRRQLETAFAVYSIGLIVIVVTIIYILYNINIF